jgi:hypothetical protein
MRLAGLASSGRLRAAAIHLGLSTGAAALLAAATWFVWYRPPFFMHDGGWQVLRLLLLVDVVLGPCLTLLVFDRAKKELRRDLAIIAAVQVAAFAYGAWILFAYRPAFIVYAERAFYSVHWRDVRRATPDATVPERLAATATAPVPVIAALPADRTERQRIAAITTAGGPAPTHYGQYYAALDAAGLARIEREATPVEELARANADVAAELARVRAAHPGRALVFVPLDLRYGLIMLVFDRESREILDYME